MVLCVIYTLDWFVFGQNHLIIKTLFDGQIFKKYLASNEPFPVRANFSDQQTVHPKINLLVSNDIPGIPDVDYSFTRIDDFSKALVQKVLVRCIINGYWGGHMYK